MLSKETLEAHIAAGDRQVDVARTYGLGRARISQLIKLYELTWPSRPAHKHGKGLRPSYKAGCAECKTLMRDITRARRAKEKP